MIVPGGRTGRPIWLYIAALSLIRCLAFIFYEAETRPVQSTIEVPIYFFVGGLAGAAALIATVAELSGADARLIRHSRWLAAFGGLISPALLIADLGMPSRFLNMLRIFKIQSPMSVGSWTLMAFSNSAAAAAVLAELKKRRPNSAVRVLTNGAQIVSALTGLVLSSYMGVLIGATAIPLWNEHVSTLPIHFAASGIASAASILELAGNESEALHRIAIGATVAETAMGASIELRRTASTRPLRHGVSGWATRGAGLLSGPLPLALRLIASFGSGSRKRCRDLRRAAAVSSLLGSFLTRFAWVHVGRVSAEDSSVPLQLKNISAE
ncbi:MAG: NrfD/PsrC family molybdoenzyme membrane anchor subunit [Candidatus Sulfotelmatobacter sp.]